MKTSNVSTIRIAAIALGAGLLFGLAANAAPALAGSDAAHRDAAAIALQQIAAPSGPEVKADRPVLRLVAQQATGKAGDGWKTYTHPTAGFSLDYPGSLVTVPGRPEEETMPSQEYEWQFPGGAEGSQGSIFLGFYDMPEDQTLQEWLEAEAMGTIETVKVGPGGSVSAFLRTALDDWAYERELFIPDEKRRIIISLDLVIQVANRGTPATIHAVEAEHAAEIETFMKMARSFRPAS